MSRISEALRITEFPAEAVRFFEEIYAKIEADTELYSHLSEAERCYYEDGDYDAQIKAMAEKSGLHQYTAEMLHLLFCIDRLKSIYKKHGYSENLLKDSMADLRYKLEECRAVHGIWGTIAFWWYKRFYECKTFKLGRLEFEWEELEFDYSDSLKKGTPVINCHIPSAGPLLPELVEDAFERAYEFFGFAETGETMPLVCESWLLYPPHYELFPEQSNMRKFYERFEIYKDWPDEKNKDAWRIFNRPDHDYKSFPQDTSLRRNFFQYLNAGNKMGNGYGIIFFRPKDEERLKRIAQMESYLDEISAAVKDLETALECGRESETYRKVHERFYELEGKLEALITYYEGPEWRADFEADEAGLLPRGMKRGVLSEDAIYNLLTDVQAVRKGGNI